MKISKAQLSVNGNRVEISMPLTKVDQEQRKVSGFASLDNVDTQGDVVLHQANVSAFARFRGNIREMHNPIAVGRMVDFKEDTYYDTNSQKFYNGIYVTVYVSKGAQDTWEKVLDGTLQGFSIGGAIREADSEWVESIGKSVRLIKDYDLVELSLVDSPANQLANVFSITKSSDGSEVIKGMVADIKSESVFWCQEDATAKTSAQESAECLNCGGQMESIGHIEYASDTDKAEKISSLIAKLKTTDNENNEGGIVVPEEVKKDDEVVTADEVVSKSDEVVTEPVNTEVVETSNEAPDLEKVLNELKESAASTHRDITAALEKNASENSDALAKAAQEFESKIGDLVKRQEELSGRFNTLCETIGTVEKRLDSVESTTAVKKSVSVENDDNSANTKGDSFWGNTLLKVSDLRNN